MEVMKSNQLIDKEQNPILKERGQIMRSISEVKGKSVYKMRERMDNMKMVQEDKGLQSSD